MTTLREHLLAILDLNRETDGNQEQVYTYLHAQAAVDLVNESEREEGGKGTNSDHYRLILDPPVRSVA